MITISSILASLDNINSKLRTLKGVELLYNSRGEIDYHIGNASVVVHILYRKEEYCLKCYLGKHPYLKEIYGDKLLLDELVTVSIDGESRWVDIVLERWCEGVSLKCELERLTQLCNTPKIKVLADNFDRLALDLLHSPISHGDLTLENIIVAPDLSLSLIDLDAAFTLELAGKPCCECGTAAFQHPSRDANTFDQYIDDYPIALISTALHIFSLEPHLFNPQSDKLLMFPWEIIDGECEVYAHSLDRFAREGMAIQYRIAQLLKAHKHRLPKLEPLLLYALRDKLSGVPSECYSENGVWGFSTSSQTNCQEVIPPIYDSAFDYSCSVAAVKIASYWHYINTQGEVVMNCSNCKAIKPALNNAARLLRDTTWETIPFE